MATARGGDADAVPAATAAVDTTDSGSGSTAGGQGEGRVGGESVSEEGGGEQAAAEGEGEWDGWGEETRVGVMNDLFRRAQERFAREAGGNERQFEIRVRCCLLVVGLRPPCASHWCFVFFREQPRARDSIVGDMYCSAFLGLRSVLIARRYIQGQGTY